jgi:putative peptidoglycan lipid II flippase
MVNSAFAAGVLDPVRGQDGPVSWLGYAFRFMQLPLGLFGVALASATLPAISRSAAEGRMDDFRRTLSRSVGMVFLLTMPSTVGLAVLGRSMIGAIYEGGRFDLYDTQQTGLALSGYAFGLVGYSAVKVLTPAFYALKDSRTPMLVSLVNVAINFFIALALTQIAGMRHEALAYTTSTVAVSGFLALFFILRRRLGGIYGRNLRETGLKVALASAVMGATVWLLSREIHAALGVARAAHLVDLAVSIPFGAAVFYFVCRILRVAELELAAASIAKPLARLLARGRGTIATT